jgi:hypothetical protein
MRNAHYRTWSIKRKLKIIENEKHTCRMRNMSRKTEKKLKMRKTHCRTWNMEKKPENGEHETQTLFDLEYGEKNLKM